MFEKIKVLLDIKDDATDEKIEIYLDFACEYVKSYCGFRDIPENLESVVCMITCSLYQQYGNATSVSIGDISMSFSKNESLFEYRNILNKYRKVGF
ncbi:MAG: head-tail connector protein [Clostridia bacterium]